MAPKNVITCLLSTIHAKIFNICVHSKIPGPEERLQKFFRIVSLMCVGVRRRCLLNIMSFTAVGSSLGWRFSERTTFITGNFGWPFPLPAFAGHLSEILLKGP